MNPTSNRLRELVRNLNGISTDVQNTSNNTLFHTLPKVNEDNNISSEYLDKFKELPDFCQHLPYGMKLALVSLKTLHNTPYEFGVAALLGYSNIACQHLFDVESYKYGIRPISLFIMILLGTGGSKSTIHNELKGPIVDFQKRMYDALQNEEMRYVTEDKIYKKEIKKWEDDKANGIHGPFPTSPKPVETAFYINEKFTVNGLIDTLISQPHISIVSAEAGAFFSSHAFQNMKQDNNRSTEMTTHLTKLWDGDTLQRIIRDERISLENRRGNLLFMVQSHVIKDILNNRMFQEQGFTHRILICQVQQFEKPDMKFDSTTLEIENVARRNLQVYLNRLSEILDMRPQIKPNTDFELEPRVLQSDNDSRELLAEYYNSTKNISNTKLQRYEGFANRLHEHCLRIAATIAIYNGHDTIKLDDAKCAVDLLNMFIDHRECLELGITDTRPEITQGAEALEVFFKKNNQVEYSKNQLRRYGPSGLRNISDEQLKSLLQELVNKDVIEAYEGVAKNGKLVQKFKYIENSVAE